MNELSILIKPLETNLVSETIDNGHRMIIGGEYTGNTTNITWTQFAKILAPLRIWNEKECYYITAIRNSLRQQNFKELTDSLNEGEITIEEYMNQINNDADKYSISFQKMNSINDVAIIKDIMNKVGFQIRDLSISDVAEMFSVNESQLLEYMNVLQTQPTKHG